MAKERIYLTDITLHTRDFRPTPNFSKVAQKGRMYSSLPKDYAETVDRTNYTARFRIDLPQDLKERLERDEVEIMVPKDGLLIYAGRDVSELIKKMDKKKRNELIHRSRSRVWRKE